MILTLLRARPGIQKLSLRFRVSKTRDKINASSGLAEIVGQAAAIAKDSAVESGQLNHYEIPSQSEIDDIVQDLPPSVLEKVIRDI